MFDAEVHVSVDVAISAPPGLRYVCDDGPAIRRKRAGKGFFYVDSRGRRVTDPAMLKRIRSLVIPPAWTDVWICPSSDGHIQATGRDAKRRKQYRYHADYREAREQSKYERLSEFAEALPTIRATVAEHMSLRGLPREKVLATVVHLLETTLIRVGNDEYARTNQSYGLTTLKSEHVAVARLRGALPVHRQERQAMVARDAGSARGADHQGVPGAAGTGPSAIFRRGQGAARGLVRRRQRLSQAIAGGDITAKDFRTWAGTVLMARFLKQSGAFESATQAKRALSAAVKQVAQALGNTPAVCRKSYIHPAVSSAYLEGALVLEAAELASGPSERTGLRPEEAAVLALLSGGQSGAVSPRRKCPDHETFGGSSLHGVGELAHEARELVDVARVPCLEDRAADPVARRVDALGHGPALRGDDGLAHAPIGGVPLALDEAEAFELGDLAADRRVIAPDAVGELHNADRAEPLDGNEQRK